VTALDATGTVVEEASVAATHPPVPVTVILSGEGIVAVVLRGAGAEGMLVRLCAVLAADRAYPG
jgi:hypothetical protein